MPRFPTPRKFSTKAKEQLRSYVYLYIDPRDNKPFYVGKGKGNRCHSHMRARRGERADRIGELRKLGLRPRIDILKYGLTENEALLVESTLSSRDRHVGVLRFELVGKPAHDLHVHESTDIFTVGKIQLGYAYYLRSARGLQLGMGGSVAGSLVPEALAPRYGGRVSPGVAVFLTVRPAAHAM